MNIIGALMQQLPSRAKPSPPRIQIDRVTIR
jgi:hypothetical protein